MTIRQALSVELTAAEPKSNLIGAFGAAVSGGRVDCSVSLISEDSHLMTVDASRGQRS